MQWITGHEKLTNVFGYWPSFHDAEVHSLTLDRRGRDDMWGPTLEAVIHVFEMTDEVDAEGYYVQKNHRLVTLRFFQVEGLELADFNQQNAIFALEFSEGPSEGEDAGKHRVAFQPAFGVTGSFKCSKVEVVSAEPYEPKDDVLPPGTRLRRVRTVIEVAPRDIGIEPETRRGPPQAKGKGRRAWVVGCIAGIIAAALVFALNCWMASLPAVTDVSICWVFRPWWRWSNWCSSLLVGAVVGLLVGILVAIRPKKGA